MAANESFDKIPPQSDEAEMSVLGSMLLDKEAIGPVLQILDKSCFYKTAHQEIYQALIDLFDRDAAVDLLLVTEELKKRDLLDKVGGPAYLTELTDSVTSSANAEHYARIVREKAMRRKLISAAAQIQREAYAEGKDGAELLDKSQKLIFDIAEKGMTREPQAIEEILRRTMERIDKLQGRQNVVTGIPTGYYKLDELTSGLQNSEFIILAARPSVGKTALALNMVEHVAVEHGMPVAIFSLEMSSQELGQRMLCSHARVDAHKMRTGFLHKDDWPKLTLAWGTLSEANIFIDDDPGLTVLGMRAKARRLKSQHDIKLIVIDYLQLMEAHKGENRQQELALISRSVKALARELDIPVLALSQLNRSPEDREGGRPRLSDLRESGALEQDADVVMLLHRRQDENRGDDDFNPGGESGTGGHETTLYIAKQRNGPQGVVRLAWLPQYVRFENPTMREAPEGDIEI